MQPLNVLIVEDEALVALLVEDAVADAGHRVVRVASNVQDAMAAAASETFDFAVLDLNLNGQMAHAIPVMLKRLGRPFLFVTGYGAEGVLREFSDVPVVSKPFRSEDVIAAIRSVTDGIAASRTLPTTA